MESHSEPCTRVVLILKYGDRLSYVSMVASFASFGTLETNRNVPEVPPCLPRSAGEPPVPQSPNALRSCLLASRTHSLVRLRIRPSEQLHDSAIAAADSSLARCRSRAAILVALVTFGALCHAQKPRRVASDVKSCETQFANCQALLGTVRGKEASNVVHLAAITPSSESAGARSHWPAAVWPSPAWTA